MFIVPGCQNTDNPMYGPGNPDPNPPNTPPAVLTAVTPDNAYPFEVVVISGSGFNPVASENMVTLGAKVCEVTAASATELTIVTPATSGLINLRVAPRGAEEWSNLLEFNLKSFIPTITDSSHEFIADDLEWPMGVDVDDAGNVYVGSATNGVIYKIDPAGTRTVFATTPVAGSIHFGPENYLYVADKDAGKVVRISPDGSTIEDVVTTHGGVRDFDWDADGNMYLIGGGNISKMPPGGSATVIASDAGSNRNCRIFGDYIYVNGVWDGSLWRFDISGATIGERELVLEGPNPLALDFDDAGVLYWTTAWESEVYLYAPRGAEEVTIYSDELDGRLRYMTYYGQDIYLVHPGGGDIGSVQKIHIGRNQAPRFGRQ
jgi:hypothetical protein